MGAAYVIRKKKYEEIKSLRETIGGEQNDTKVSKIQKAREAWTDKPRVLHASVAATTCISEGLLSYISKLIRGSPAPWDAEGCSKCVLL